MGINLYLGPCHSLATGSKQLHRIKLTGQYEWHHKLLYTFAVKCLCSKETAEAKCRLDSTWVWSETKKEANWPSIELHSGVR